MKYDYITIEGDCLGVMVEYFECDGPNLLRVRSRYFISFRAAMEYLADEKKIKKITIQLDS